MSKENINVAVDWFTATWTNKGYKTLMFCGS